MPAAVPVPDALPVVLDRHLDVAVAVVDEHLGPRRLRVLHHIRQPLLHQPVRSQVDAGGKLGGLALDSHFYRQARFPRLLDETAQVIEARLWSKGRRLFGPPQHAYHPAHLGERLAAGPLDDEQRLALTLLVGP